MYSEDDESNTVNIYSILFYCKTGQNMTNVTLKKNHVKIIFLQL